MTELRKFKRALIEAAAPELREALHGREPSEERFQREFEYQLRARGVLGDDDG